jgi:hypothetical protein
MKGEREGKWKGAAADALAIDGRRPSRGVGLGKRRKN